MREEPYVVLGDGKAAWTGDYVACNVNFYSSIEKGERRRIQRIEDGCITLNNSDSPIGTSNYRSSNFILAGRHHPNHKLEKTNMLHIAIQMRPGASMADMASFLMNASSAPMICAGVTKEEIQERIRTRLSLYPDEKWLILSGHTIGERADPPVRFRSL